MRKQARLELYMNQVHLKDSFEILRNIELICFINPNITFFKFI